MNCIGHLAPGQWTAPDDQSARYVDPDYWIDLAKLLERGLFDRLFLGDVLAFTTSTREVPTRHCARPRICP